MTHLEHLHLRLACYRGFLKIHPQTLQTLDFETVKFLPMASDHTGCPNLQRLRHKSPTCRVMEYLLNVEHTDGDKDGMSDPDSMLQSLEWWSGEAPEELLAEVLGHERLIELEELKLGGLVATDLDDTLLRVLCSYIITRC